MIDLAIVLVFVGYSVVVGFRSRRAASQNLDEYFLAGRTLRGWRAGVSMAATQYAADTPLLVAGLVAVGGLYSLWRLWIYGLAFLLMGLLLGRAWRRAQVLTDAELTAIRYSGRGAPLLRTLKAVYYGTIVNCVVMALVLVAATRIFEIFLPWHEWLPASLYNGIEGLTSTIGLDLSSGTTALPRDVATTNSLISIVAMLGFVALYSTTGGLRSVVSTDVVQFAFMMLGTFLYAGFAVADAGGRDRLLAQLQGLYGPERSAEMLSFVPPLAELVPSFLTILALQWLFQMNSDGTGYLAQRTMACSSDREARIASVVFTFAQIVVRSLAWLAIVVALLVLYPLEGSGPYGEAAIAAREVLFAQGIDDLLPAGARGLMLTGMLAALASTLDTHLNWGASYWSNDLYKGLWVERIRGRTAAPHELVIVARLSNLVILSLALVIMVNLGSIQTAWQVSLLFGAGIGSVLVLRWLWERVNLYSEIASMAVSLVVAPILLVLDEPQWLELATMAGISTAAVVLTALFAPATAPECLAEFYRRVQPPGWWRRTARIVGDDPERAPRELRFELLGVGAAAASAYGLLIGGGLLLLKPGDWLGAVAALILAIVAVPIWLRRL